MPIPNVKSGETQNDYVGRCMSAIASEYDTNEQAVAICINTYEKGNMSKDMMNRVALKVNGVRMIELAAASDEYAAEGDTSLPWEDCIAKMQDEGYDEESSNNICGWIKANYGS
jgi:hypothetical protein